MKRQIIQTPPKILWGGATEGSDSKGNTEGNSEESAAGDTTTLNKEAADSQTVVFDTEQSGLAKSSLQNSSNENTAALVKSAQPEDANNDVDSRGNENEVKDSVVATIGKIGYSSLEGAVSNAKDGDTIIIKANVTATETLTVPEQHSLTIDLNGNQIESRVAENKAPVEVKGKLTIKDSGNNGSLKSSYSLVVDGTEASLTLESGTITVTGDYGIYSKNGSSVVVNGGAITSLYSPLTGNNTTGNMNFKVNAGTLTAECGPAIYMPGQTSLTITGGTLNGGVSLRMGSIRISGGEINAVKQGIDSPAEYYNYSGNAWLPDALYVFGGTYTTTAATDNVLDIEITGGTFNCTNEQGSAVAIYDIGKVEQSMSVKISDNAVLKTNATGRKAYQVLSLNDIGVENPKPGYGNDAYTGKVSSALSGGYYSAKVDSNYCAGGLVPSDDRSDAGTPEGAPFTVTNKITVSFKTKLDSEGSGISYEGKIAGDKLTDTEKSAFENQIKAAENRGQVEGKTCVFQGWYTEDGAKIDLKAPERWPEKNTTYYAYYKLVNTPEAGNKASAGDAEGNALPKTNNNETVKAKLEATENAAAVVASAEVAKIKVNDNERVTVVVTVEANTKVESEVGTDADAVKQVKTDSETVSYFDISLLKTVVKETTSDSGNNWEKESTSTSNLTSVTTEIPITLNVSSLNLGGCFYRVAHVHDGILTYLASDFDKENNLLTIKMKEFSTVAILTSATSTVTFDSKGGSKVASETITYSANAKVTQPTTAPTRSGYTFAGWFSDEACTSAYNFETTVTSPAVTLYAKWTPVSTGSSGGSHKHHSSNTTTTTAAAASAVTTVSGAKTGDSANLTLWAVLIVLAGVCAACIVYYEKKKKRC